MESTIESASTTTLKGTLRRSRSNRSSSASDILVATAPPAMAGTKETKETASSGSGMMARKRRDIAVEVRDWPVIYVLGRTDAGRDTMKRLLTKMSKEDEAAFAIKKASTSKSIPEIAVKGSVDDDDDGEGPNHRGTYSKAYTLLHPEIKWTHRGQGRYLPATVAETMTQSHQVQTPKEPRSRGSLLLRASTDEKQQQQQQTRSSRAQRRSSPVESEEIANKPSLRRRITAGSAAAAAEKELLSVRSGRRAKTTSTHELERRSSRISTQVDYDEDSEEEDSSSDDDDDDDMAGDKEETFDKAWVDAHPDERYYHTGNGWYKRGKRPPGRLNAKKREEAGQAVKRRSDGTYEFTANSTIHVSQLEHYPGVEFHHRGNGWYRPGRDESGLRASRYGGPPDYGDDEDGGTDDGVGLGEDDEDDVAPTKKEDDEDFGTVSKAYTLKHPEIAWTHRGKGRYRRKSAVNSIGNGTPASMSLEPERDPQIYTKAYKDAHPEEEFHHRGNARYMRGPPPGRWAASRDQKKMAAKARGFAPQDEDKDDEEELPERKLYDKAYKQAHPHLEFQHRGQGRYAMLPRKTSEGDDEEKQGLVDINYVEAHPGDTFHHRGGGRWARGLPPAGASKKVAIRGPGANDSEDIFDEFGNRAPPLTSLVTKAEGPERWPQIDWHYRGGGKWSRITKQQFQELQRGNGRRSISLMPKGRLSRSSGPGAQLERETAAASGEYDEDDGLDAGDVDGEDGYGSTLKSQAKRRRIVKRGSYQGQESGPGTKRSSKDNSQAPTPRPRMLEPEEDILTDEDLPQLYRDDWSPPSEYIEDPVERIVRRPLTNPDKFVKALTKHDPAIRPLDNLKLLAANTQKALDAIQQEYLALDRITAPHHRVARKPLKGGRLPVDDQIFEDKKEADLYDYTYDPRRLGFQDPEAQRIQRDADGRELRNRRNRSGAVNSTLPGWNFGDDEPLGPRRAVKPVNRFDGIVDPPRKRQRRSVPGTGLTSKAPSMTPDRGSTPLGGPVRIPTGTFSGGRGRMMATVPKRIQELRGESVGVGASGSGVIGDGKRDVTPGGTARKGRPPGSKNLHRRKDAGIKKGPRKPKVVGDGVEGVVGEVEGREGREGSGNVEMEL